MKDKYGREIDYLRISLIGNYNLRCIYCMEEKNNTFLRKEDKSTNDEIYKIVCESAKFDIKKARFTGGEPLVEKDIVELMQKTNTIQGIEEIYLATNGILLEESVEILTKAGLKGINISLDSLKREIFKRLIRLGDLNKVLAAVDKCISLGVKVKLNTAMIEDINDDEIVDLVNLTLQEPIDVRFIELMPIGVGSKYKGINNEAIIDIIKNSYKDFGEAKRIKSGGPATHVKLKDAKGKIGFISAISNCFYEDYNRIKLAPKGFLKQCLHFNYSIGLEKLIRKGGSDNELSLAVENSIFDKPEKHLFMQESNDEKLKFMNQTGG